MTNSTNQTPQFLIVEDAPIHISISKSSIKQVYPRSSDDMDNEDDIHTSNAPIGAVERFKNLLEGNHQEIIVILDGNLSENKRDDVDEKCDGLFFGEEITEVCRESTNTKVTILLNSDTEALNNSMAEYITQTGLPIQIFTTAKKAPSIIDALKQTKKDDEG